MNFIFKTKNADFISEISVIAEATRFELVVRLPVRQFSKLKIPFSYQGLTMICKPLTLKKSSV